jgi:NTE family protein
MGKKKVALALGSGGARGFTHAGVIQELIKNDFEIHSIAGTSIGAFIGAVYASDKLDEFLRWMYTRKFTDFLGFIDISLHSPGFIKAEKFMHELRKIIPDTNIEDLPISFCSITTDILTKQEVVINKGSLYEAVRASVAFPLVFTPFEKEKGLYIDGGIVNPIPVNRVKRVEDDILIAVDLGFDSPLMQKEEKKINGNKKKINSIDILNQTVDVLLRKVATLTLEQNPPDISIKVPKSLRKTFDFANVEELVEFGRKATVEGLNEYSKLKSSKKAQKTIGLSIGDIDFNITVTKNEKK